LKNKKFKKKQKLIFKLNLGVHNLKINKNNFSSFLEQLYDNYYKNTGMVFRARRGSSSISEIVGGGTSRKRRGIIWECW